MPGFPIVLAISNLLLRDSLLAARLLLAAMGTAACWLVYVLGKELFDRQTGLTAAALTAVSPAMAGFSIVILSETLFAVCLLGSLITIAKLVSRERQRTSLPVESCSVGHRNLVRHRAFVLPCLLTGIFAAAACYVRPSWLPAGPILTALAVAYATPKQSHSDPVQSQPGKAHLAVRGTGRNGQDRLRRSIVVRSLASGLLVLAGLLAALSFWGIRNAHATGRFVLTTLWMGPSLYDGLNPNATGASDMSFLDQESLSSRMTEYEVDRHYRREAWRFVCENPGRTMELAVIKLGRFWKPWPSAGQFSGFWPKLAVSAFFLPISLFAAYGWWTSRRQVASWLLTVGPIFYFSVLHTVFVGSLRYRLPAEYPLCVLSAVGLLEMSSWLLRRNRHGLSAV